MPATVVMIPSGPTRRMRLLPSIGDVEAAVRADGDAMGLAERRLGGRPAVAAVARQPPVPATVVMIPSGPTRRTRLVPGIGDVEAAVRPDGDCRRGD